MGTIVALPKCKRLKPEQAAAFRQMAFEFELTNDVRVELDNAIYKLTAEPSERWLFMRISPEQIVLTRTSAGTAEKVPGRKQQRKYPSFGWCQTTRQHRTIGHDQ